MDNGYELNDFTTAENINRLIEYNIDSKNSKTKRDKHIRGVVGTVTGNTCDLYLYNSTEAIPNIKINGGLSIYEGDIVYALAINGNLNNLIIDTKVHNFEAMFGIKLDNFKLIEGFQDSTDWTNI